VAGKKVADTKMRWRRLHCAALAGALSLAISGCSLMQRTGIWGPLGPDGFYNVHFGDSFTDVRMRYPAGEAQSSPLGANSYRLRDVVDRGVRYDPVI
jgi:hypothetical protein